MNKTNIKQFKHTGKLKGNLEQVQSSFKDYTKEKEVIRLKSRLPPGNYSSVPIDIIVSQLRIRQELIYRADNAHIRHNCIIVILTNGSQVNTYRY